MLPRQPLLREMSSLTKYSVNLIQVEHNEQDIGYHSKLLQEYL